MTGIADRLEERGLVVRGPDPDDRRVKVLGLTRAGRAIVAKMDRPMATELSGYADLSDAEKRQLAALLEKAFG
jgi:DNA-binding MarR family transcriptional regulator